MKNSTPKVVPFKAPVKIIAMDEWTFKQRLLANGMSPERVDEILAKARAAATLEKSK